MKLHPYIGICHCYFQTVDLIVNVVSVMVSLNSYFATRSVESLQENSSLVNLSASSLPDKYKFNYINYI